MNQPNITVQTVGKPDIGAMTGIEQRSFLETLLKRIVELSEKSRARHDWKTDAEPIQKHKYRKVVLKQKVPKTASRDFRMGTEVG